MRSRAVLLLVLLPLVAGCTDPCVDPPEGSTVTIARVDEEARTLPLLRSGETGAVEMWPGYHLVNVPDAHGYLDVSVNMTGFPKVDVRDLALSIAIDGRAIPTRLLRVYGGGDPMDLEEPKDDRWSDEVRANTTLRLYWTVHTSLGLASLVLAEGATYTATVTFDWSYRGCAQTYNGRVDRAFDDFIEASANARTFEPAGPAQIERTPTGVGFLAPFRIRSGLDATIEGVDAAAYYVGATPALGVTAPAAGVVAFPSVAWEVDGLNASLVTPANELAIFSAGLEGAYTTSGTPPAAPGDALFVVLVGIHYTPTDPTLGVQRDDFALPVLALSGDGT